MTTETKAPGGVSKRKGAKPSFFKPFLDGTIYDTLFYKAANEGDLKNLYKVQNDFHELNQPETKHKRLDAYADILKDEETWAEMNDKMNSHFDDIIEMFPYERRNLKGDTGALKDLKITNPENFFKITLETIERRFPGGTGGTVGDQDMRNLTNALRVIYKSDLWTLIKKRRMSALRSLIWIAFVTFLSAIGLALSHGFPKVATPFGDIEWTIPALAGAAILLAPVCIYFLRDELRQIKITYESALKASASNLRGPLHARLSETVSLIPQIMARIDREKMELLAKDRLKEWPDVVTRWSKLAFWLSARVEALENYIQVQMWLIRRTHFGLRHLAGIISFVMGVGYVAVMACLVVLGNFAIYSVDHNASAFAYVALWVIGGVNLIYGLMAVLNGQNYRLPQVELQDILQMHLIMGHNDTKLHDEIADLIKREKLSILHEEEMSRGPKPR